MRNQLAKPQKNILLQKLSALSTINPSYKPFGDGHAAQKILQHIQLL